MDKVVVVVKDEKSQKPLERYIFALDSMLDLEKVDKDVRFLRFVFSESL